jgi:hypothetical protein
LRQRKGELLASCQKLPLLARSDTSKMISSISARFPVAHPARPAGRDWARAPRRYQRLDAARIMFARSPSARFAIR